MLLHYRNLLLYHFKDQDTISQWLKYGSTYIIEWQVFKPKTVQCAFGTRKISLRSDWSFEDVRVQLNAYCLRVLKC